MSEKLYKLIAARSFDQFPQGAKFNAYILRAHLENKTESVIIQLENGKAFDIPYDFIEFSRD